MAELRDMDPETRAFLTMYKWRRIDPTPWADWTKDLGRARLGLVALACRTLADQPRFHARDDGGDTTFRVIPAGIDPNVLVDSFPEQGFDHAGVTADANLLIPLDRLRDLVATGEIGSVSPRMVSVCGHITKPDRLVEETAPQMARVFVEDGADAVLVVAA